MRPEVEVESWKFPRPDPHGPLAPHFEGLRRHRILVQECAGCGSKRWFPKPACHRCWSFDTRWEEIEGVGVVHSWTTVHHPFAPASRDDVPYQIVIVELEQGIRVVGRVAMEHAPQITIGREVRATFEDVDDDLTLLFFEPVHGTDVVA